MGLVKQAYDVGRKLAAHDRLAIGAMVSMSVVIAGAVAGAQVSNAIQSGQKVVTDKGWECIMNEAKRTAFCRLP